MYGPTNSSNPLERCEVGNLTSYRAVTQRRTGRISDQIGCGYQERASAARGIKQQYIWIDETLGSQYVLQRCLSPRPYNARSEQA